MKNRLITSIAFLILGIFIAIGPQTIFPICGLENEISTKMKCFWTGRTEIGIGIIITVIGILLLILKKKEIRIGLSLALIPTGLLVLLIPTTLIGVCANEHMKCKALTLPMLLLLGSVTIVVAAINSIYLAKADRRNIGDK